MKYRWDPTLPDLAEIERTVDDLVQLQLVPCRYEKLTPFAFHLGSQKVLVLARIEVPEDSPVEDQWPDTLGNPVRILGGDHPVEGLRIVFATRENGGQPSAVIRIWLGKTAE